MKMRKAPLFLIILDCLYIASWLMNVGALWVWVWCGWSVYWRTELCAIIGVIGFWSFKFIFYARNSSKTTT